MKATSSDVLFFVSDSSLTAVLCKSKVNILLWCKSIASDSVMFVYSCAMQKPQADQSNGTTKRLLTYQLLLLL